MTHGTYVVLLSGMVVAFAERPSMLCYHQSSRRTFKGRGEDECGRGSPILAVGVWRYSPPKKKILVKIMYKMVHSGAYLV